MKPTLTRSTPPRGVWVAPWVGEHSELVLYGIDSRRLLAIPPVTIRHGADRVSAMDAALELLDRLDPDGLAIPPIRPPHAVQVGRAIPGACWLCGSVLTPYTRADGKTGYECGPCLKVLEQTDRLQTALIGEVSQDWEAARHAHEHRKVPLRIIAESMGVTYQGAWSRARREGWALQYERRAAAQAAPEGGDAPAQAKGGPDGDA